MQPFRLRYADQIVAAFLLAVATMVVVTLFFVVKGQGLLKRRIGYTTVFKDGGGIAPETPVRIAGIEVGSVRSVRLTDDDRVEVVFDVLEAYSDRLRADPTDGSCEARSSGFLLDDDDEKRKTEASQKRCGSRVAASVPAGLGAFLPTSGLVIRVGHRDNPLVAPGGLVPADEPEGLSELFARLQKEGIVQSARDIITQIDEILRRVNDENGPIQGTIRNVEAVTARAAEGNGLVGEITRDNSPTQRRVAAALEKVDLALADLQKASADVATLTATVRSKDAEIRQFVEAMDAFGKDAKTAGSDLSRFAADAKQIPPDVREAVHNLNRRIDDLGAIITGLKKTFPFSTVVDDDEPRAGQTPPTPATEKK
jgi:phospholipid/cholesterol/gamma-HCH transport system substrate-binding protein